MEVLFPKSSDFQKLRVCSFVLADMEMDMEWLVLYLCGKF